MNKSKLIVLNLLVSGNHGGIEHLCADVARLSDVENHFYFMWDGGVVADEISTYTDKVKVRHFRYTGILAEYKALKEYIITNNINTIIIQIPSPVYLLYLYFIDKKNPGIKKYIYIHSAAEDIFMSWIKRIQFKLIVKRANGCIAISNYVKHTLSEYCDERKIKVIYNGIDCNKFVPKLAEGKNSVFQLIYVGRLIHEKGLDILLEALCSIDINYHLTIVGDGPEREKLEKFCIDNRMHEKVNFLGNRKDISNLLQSADLFVHPARWNEGFGITIVEAMASAVPSIVFDRGALGEIIDDDVNGFIVDNFSVAGMADKIVQVYNLWNNSYESFERISLNAVEKAKAFDINRYINELCEYLNSEGKTNENIDD